MSLNSKFKKIIKILKSGGVGILPTDTLYGLVGSAFSQKAVKRIYRIRKRNKKKKLIVLISSINDLKKFGISDRLIRTNGLMLKKLWPGKVSVILSGWAFRLPKKKSLIEILEKTGPLVAPSANPEGLKPAENITQAKKYFGDKVDFYLAGRQSQNKPSKLVKIEGDKIVVLRK